MAGNPSGSVTNFTADGEIPCADSSAATSKVPMLLTPFTPIFRPANWPTIAAMVISGSSGVADVNAALPVPELHPAAKADVTTIDAAEIVTPKSHRAEKLRVRIVVLPPKSQPGS